MPVSSNLSDETNVIVMVNSSEAANRLMFNAARGGYHLNKKVSLPSISRIMLDFQRPPGVTGIIAINDMKRMEPSARVALDHEYSLQSRRYSPYGREYANRLLNWPENGCHAHMPIGMIDGHVDVTAPGLQNAEITQLNFAGEPAGATTHGTAVAMLLVGPGRLQQAHLYTASVVGENTSSRTGVFEIVEAIDWLKSNEVALVNVSLAGPHNAVLESAVRSASDQGMVFVAAVGNSGPLASPLYPAAFEQVIAVTAVDAAHAIYNRAVRGEHVDFAAPGVDVFIDDGVSANYWSGTSFSAPFVTALLASNERPADIATADHIRQHMGQQVMDLGVTGRDTIFGLGLARVGQNCSQ